MQLMKLEAAARLTGTDIEGIEYLIQKKRLTLYLRNGERMVDLARLYNIRMGAAIRRVQRRAQWKLQQAAGNRQAQCGQVIHREIPWGK